MATVSTAIPIAPTPAPVKRTVTRRKAVPKVVIASEASTVPPPIETVPIATPIPVTVESTTTKSLDTLPLNLISLYSSYT